jgi:hypothetical protein
VDIRSETEFAEEEAEMGYQEEEVSGRCAAILANGKRCPNASLPGSRYCGLPAHQALEGTGTDYLVPPEDEGGDEEPAGDGAEAAAAATGEVALETASSENGDLPVEDLVEEAPEEEVPLEESVAEPPVDDNPAATATADQPTDQEPVADLDPVPEDPPEDPDGPVPTDPDEDLDSDHVAVADLPSEPIDAETETPDVSAADEPDESAEEAEES